MKIHTQKINLLADLYTPIQLYLELQGRYPNALLLESSDYHSKEDSRSYICLQPIAGFEARVNSYKIKLPGRETQNYPDVLNNEIAKAFKAFILQFKLHKKDDRDQPAGLFGYTSFEAVQYFEDICFSDKNSKIKDNPDLLYQLYRYVIEIDHFKDQMTIHKYDFKPILPDDEGLKTLCSQLGIRKSKKFPFSLNGTEESPITDEALCQNIQKGIEHCQKGDVYQVVLSRSFSQAFQGDEFNVYRCLRSINPSPYLFYFDYGNFKLFGSSPEAQVKVKGDKAMITPIAGTIKRSGDETEDRNSAIQLKNDPKEMSEHVMLVDLARNDLSKSAKNVKVEKYAEPQFFSHIIHLVSEVQGEILKNKNGIDIYFETFPAGTLSGAPKYSALKIIDNYETEKRNYYGGAVGFIGFDGSVNHAIMIRSVLSKNGKLTYQAGAGTVAGSTPDGERKEIENKVAAIRTAIKKAASL